MSEIINKPLGEIADLLDCLHKTPSYTESGIPMVRVTDIKQGYLKLDGCLKISDDDYVAFSKGYTPRIGDIVFTRVGSYGVSALVNCSEKFCLGQNTVLLLPRSIDGRFLYYYLTSDDCKSEIESLVGGSTQPTISMASIRKIMVPTPAENEQRAIAEVLSSLDDKIDLLHRNNKTLEEMAEVMFRNMFNIEDDSLLTRGHIGDFFVETIGGEWGKETPDEEHSIEVRCIRGTDIGNLLQGLANPPTRFVTEKKFSKCAVQSGDIIIEISGGTDDQSTGRARFFDQNTIDALGGKVIFSNFCRLLRPKDSSISLYLYVYLKAIYDRGDFFNLENGSSGIRNLALKAFLNDEQYPLASLKDAKLFSARVEPLFNKVSFNKAQIIKLATIRDTLLPKLMSGQVRVKPQ